MGKGAAGTTDPALRARTAKAGELIRRVIASELEYIEDERLELVSLTGVDVDRDLHKAVIYFTTFDRTAIPRSTKRSRSIAADCARGEPGHAAASRAELEFRSDSTLRSAGAHRGDPASGGRAPTGARSRLRCCERGWGWARRRVAPAHTVSS